MSGKRAKQIRKQFIVVHGRPPAKAGWTEPETENIQYHGKVKTRLGWLTGKLKKLVHRTVKHRSDSEWRRVKREWAAGPPLVVHHDRSIRCQATWRRHLWRDDDKCKRCGNRRMPQKAKE